MIDEFEATFRRAVEIRLRADVPVVGYLSGGVDSAYVLATASKLRGSPVPSFTIQVPGKGLDETDDALFTARAIGCRPTILRCDSTVIANTYPQLIASADCPVIDTSCAALWRLSQEVHDQGYKVALTGEGSDEAFAGYIWFKLRKLGYFLDVGGTHASDAVNRLFRMRMSPHMSNAQAEAHRRHDGPRARADAALSPRLAVARPLLQRRDEGSARRLPRLRGRADRRRARAPLGSAQPVALLRLQDPPSGPVAQPQGRPRRHGQQRRDPLPVPRRERHRLRLQAASAPGSCAA